MARRQILTDAGDSGPAGASALALWTVASVSLLAAATLLYLTVDRITSQLGWICS